jgi:cbb3-type cytochrome oxidase subunit 3
MKFIHYLERIGGVDIYPMLSLIIFGSFFIVVLVWLYSVDKSYFDEIANIPLQENEQDK